MWKHLETWKPLRRDHVSVCSPWYPPCLAQWLEHCKHTVSICGMKKNDTHFSNYIRARPGNTLFPSINLFLVSRFSKSRLVLFLKEWVAVSAISVMLADLEMWSEMGRNTILCQPHDLPRDTWLLSGRTRSQTSGQTNSKLPPCLPTWVRVTTWTPAVIQGKPTWRIGARNFCLHVWGWCPWEAEMDTALRL